MYGGIIDRIPDEFKPDREGWAHIAMAALIAILISSLIVLSLLPSKATTADVDRIDNALESQAQDIDALENAGPYATVEDLGNVNIALTNYALDVIDLGWRVTANENTMAGIVASPYEWQLDNEYQLHISGNGTFTANIHLCFDPTVSTNATSYGEAVAAFYDSINWVTANHDYIPVVTYDGTEWSVTRAWFSIGTFTVTAEKTIDLTVAGLNSTYAVGCTYAEVYKS